MCMMEIYLVWRAIILMPSENGVLINQDLNLRACDTR
jgi:hypothetical protein